MRIPIRPLVEPVLGGALGELGNSAVTGALVDVEFVMALQALDAVDDGDVDVESAVPVYVSHRDAGRPVGRSGHSGGLGHVLELEVALIEVELVRALIGRKIEIRETVAIEVAYCHAPSVVVVEVVEDVEGWGFSQRIRERHTGTLRREAREQRWRRRIIAAGRAAKEERAKKDEKSRPIH